MFRSSLSLDRTHRILTVVSSAIVAVVLGVALSTRQPPAGLAAAFVLAVLAVAWAMGPRELVVEGGEMRIERRAWRPLRVPLSQVESAAPLESIGRIGVRLAGVGGFFGAYGLFWTTALGFFRLYATRRGQKVIVRRRGALPIVMTPTDVAGAVDAIDPRARKAQS